MAGLHTIAFATHDTLAFSGWPMCCALDLLRLLFQFGRILIQTADLSGAAGPFMDAKNACCRGSIVTGMGCVFVPLGCASRPPRLSSPVRRSFCIVPYLTLLTRKPFAAVVFSAFLLGCMKGVAGVVVNLVYGWGDGHHEIPWTAPNLMLSTFWVAASVLSVSFYLLGVRKFRTEYGQTV